MKSKLVLALVFIVGAVLGALFSPWRYQLVTEGNMIVYRLDRFTGGVDSAMAGGSWRRIGD